MNAFKCDKGRQLQIEECIFESMVEPKDKRAELNTKTTFKAEENGVGETFSLLEKVLEPRNIALAIDRVISNKGACGVDNMPVEALREYFERNEFNLCESIKYRNYKPSPVRRVEIPKSDGGIRLLGVPTATDRVIQQAISQILSPIYEKIFADQSYGFRKQRSCKMAITKSKEYIDEGYNWIVDIDLAKYFDTVNHDKLMRLLSNTIQDGDLLSIIRKYLTSGVEINGVKFKTTIGCPQGGPLSPLLSNIMLHELDKELIKRNLKFVRYADDCNIYVKSKRASERVMRSVTKFLEVELKLKVNETKSKIGKPWEVKFLGFSFYSKKRRDIGIRIHEKSINRFKETVKEVTCRKWSIDMETRISILNQKIIGWVGYFAVSDMKKLSKDLDGWIRRRLRMCYWKQWKKIGAKKRNLEKLGMSKEKAWMNANTRKSYWRIAGSPTLSTTLTNEYFRNIGLQSIEERYLKLH